VTQTGVRVGRTGLVARAVVSVVLLAALVHGSIGGSDDWWPFGPMSQYAMTVTDNDRIVSTYLMAETVDGTRVRVPLSSTGCGIGRAEIEGQAGSIVADPSRLQTVAESCERLHPDAPRYVRIDLVQDTTVLDRGRAGAPTTDVLTTWTVKP
jgi:hypothetical protein